MIPGGGTSRLKLTGWMKVTFGSALGLEFVPESRSSSHARLASSPREAHVA
jgi:hypothetical protein